MKKILMLFLVCYINHAGYSQELLMDTEDVYEADVIQPKFNGGGLDKFYDFVYKEFDFSKVTKKGKLLVGFTIDEAGELKNIKVLKVLDEPQQLKRFVFCKCLPSGKAPKEAENRLVSK
jgi:hypothetical protein